VKKRASCLGWSSRGSLVGRECLGVVVHWEVGLWAMLRQVDIVEGYSPGHHYRSKSHSPGFVHRAEHSPRNKTKGPHPLISIGLRSPPGDHHSIAVMQKHCLSVSLALVCDDPPSVHLDSQCCSESRLLSGGSNVRTQYTDSRGVIHLLAFISHAYLIRQPCYFHSITSRPPFVHVAFRPDRKSHFSGTLQKSHSKQIAMMPSHADDLFLLTYR
jgi:hypothetical protein